MLSNNENRDICSKCTKRCCEIAPCCYMPEDLGLDPKNWIGIVTKIELTGYLSIVRNKQGFLYIRPKREGGEVVDLQIDGNTRCSLLGENGCTLSFEDRPSGGKALVPSSDFRCKTLLSEAEIYKAWLPYQKVLKFIVEGYV